MSHAEEKAVDVRMKRALNQFEVTELEEVSEKEVFYAWREEKRISLTNE